MRLLPFILLLFLPLSLAAQTDTLFTHFESIHDPAQRADSMMSVAISHRRKNPEMARKLLDKALQVSRAAHAAKQESYALLFSAQLTKDHGLAESAMPIVREAMQVAKAAGLDAPYISGLRDLGTLMEETGKPDSALHYFFLSEKAYLKAGMNYEVLFSYLLIGDFYDNQDDFEKAEEYLLKAFRIADSLRIRMDYGFLLYKLTVFYKKYGKLEAFSNFGERYYAFVMERQHPLNKEDISHFSFIFSQTNPDKATSIRQLEEMLPIHEQLGNARILGEAYFELGKLNGETGNWEASANWYDKGIALAREIGVPARRLELLLFSFEANKEARNYPKAIGQIEAYLSLYDSVKTEQSRINLEALEVKFETEKKQQQIEIQQLQLDKERNTRWLLTGGLGVTFLLMAFVTYALYQKNRLNRELAGKNRVIADNLNQREMLLREIHHRVKNNLQMISSLLRLQSRFISDPEALKAIADGRERVRSMALIHEHLYQHRDLQSIAMPDYLSGLVTQIAQSYPQLHQRVSIEMEIGEVSLEIDRAISIGLIINELITNAFKHAFNESEAGTISVSLFEKAGNLEIVVGDNGKGLEGEQGQPGFGLELIRTLANRLQASFAFQSQEGTWARLSVPLAGLPKKTI